jgi:hypothetical protein
VGRAQLLGTHAYSRPPVLGPPASNRGRSFHGAQVTGLRPFVADRNICNFVWYGVGAGEGLRSDGVDDLPLSKSGCSILPIARHLSGWGPTGAPAFSRSAPPRCHCVSYVHKGSRVLYIRNSMSDRGPDRGPPASIGVGRCCLACLAEVLVSKSACQPVSPLCVETTYA